MTGSVMTNAERVGEVLVVRAAGVLGIRAVGVIRLRIWALLLRQDARAIVVNLRSAVPMLTEHSWQAIQQMPTGEFPQPVAIVMCEMHQGELRSYCLDMARRGLGRGPFTEELSAISWASRCREHWPHRPR